MVVDNKIRTFICDITGIYVRYSVDQIYQHGRYHLNVYNRREIRRCDTQAIVDMIEMHHGINIYNAVSWY